MKLRDLYQKLDSDGRTRLAAKAGISRPYLSQLVAADRTPSLKTIMALSAADSRLKVADLVAEFHGAKSTAARRVKQETN